MYCLWLTYTPTAKMEVVHAEQWMLHLRQPLNLKFGIGLFQKCILHGIPTYLNNLSTKYIKIQHYIIVNIWETYCKQWVITSILYSPTKDFCAMFKHANKSLPWHSRSRYLLPDCCWPVPTFNQIINVHWKFFDCIALKFEDKTVLFQCTSNFKWHYCMKRIISQNITINYNQNYLPSCGNYCFPSSPQSQQGSMIGKKNKTL